jgi:hypothetical protein
MDFQALVGVMMNQIFPPRHIGSCDKIAPIGLVLGTLAAEILSTAKLY